MILVGVDGSRSALAAVRWAALEAERRQVGLRLVEACPWGAADVEALPDDKDLGSLLRRTAQDQVQEAVEVAGKVVPDLAVSADVETGHPIPVLVDASHGAEILVLGNRGLGGVTGMLAGSVVIALAAHAVCPVVVVRGEERPPAGPVVVGVDGSPASDAALRFAVEAASARGVPLVALHTWRDPLLSPPAALLLDRAALKARARHFLSGQVAAVCAEFPAVRVEQVVAWDVAATALVERSTGAQLVVVGSRGRGGFAGLVLGSVSHALLHHAHCPVAVVRPGC